MGQHVPFTKTAADSAHFHVLLSVLYFGKSSHSPSDPQTLHSHWQFIHFTKIIDKVLPVSCYNVPFYRLLKMYAKELTLHHNY